MKRFERYAWGLVSVLALGACGGQSEPVPEPPTPRGSIEVRRVVPTDSRPVRSAATTPPAISGGTLLVSSDDAYAFAADPDRDRVSVIDIPGNRLLHTIALQPGDEPGRLAQDGQGRVHVALRRGGAVVSIDPTSGTVLGRHAVCGAPRGIAFDAGKQQLHVACAGGELVSLSPDDGTIARRIALGTDLRDVLVQNDTLLVTRFKSAEVLRVDAEGRVMSVRQPAKLTATIPEDSGAQLIDTLDARVAWRTVMGSDGQLLMLHQRARNGEIELPEHGTESEAVEPAEANGRVQEIAGRGAIAPVGIGGASAYGGNGSGCSGVVQTELTRMGVDTQQEMSNRIPAVLVVDVAISPYDGTIALALAGAADPEQPQVTFEVVERAGSSSSGGAAPAAIPSGSRAQIGLIRPDSGLFDSELARSEANPCLPFLSGTDPMGQPIAVAFTKQGVLVTQTREPARVALFSPDLGVARAVVELGGPSAYDTGHEIFHRDAGAGMACASCHAEGGEDGHVWVFSTFGKRRTQSLHVGIEGTAPFHWQGDMNDLSTLMEEVLVGRMGGVHQSPARAGALQSWLFELQPPAPVRAPGDPAAERGRALFEGQAECSTCHSGPKLTDNRTVDVGTGEPLQVPSLVGVAYRAPFIHNGCATDLRQRFDPSCGGASHGKTAALSPDQLDDLIAYLETL